MSTATAFDLMARNEPQSAYHCTECQRRAINNALERSSHEHCEPANTL